MGPISQNMKKKRVKPAGFEKERHLEVGTFLQKSWKTVKSAV